MRHHRNAFILCRRLCERADPAGADEKGGVSIDAGPGAGRLIRQTGQAFAAALTQRHAGRLSRAMSLNHETSINHTKSRREFQSRFRVKDRINLGKRMKEDCQSIPAVFFHIPGYFFFAGQRV